ncbi:glycosyl hydrolase family 65 protein [Agrilactobacillus fermenti]|uniref:glycosyl hydrolase family 65 protein n=1 Tax=Agrilactobacillus fermenti TaxID=2586909 RepID=UPI003A5C0CD5
MQKLFELDPWYLRSQNVTPAQTAVLDRALAQDNGVIQIKNGVTAAFGGKVLPGKYLQAFLPNEAQPQEILEPLPEFGNFQIYFADQMITPTAANAQDYQIDLNLKNGVMTQSFLWVKADLKLEITLNQFLSQVDLSAVQYQLAIKMISGTGTLTVTTGLNAAGTETVQSDDVSTAMEDGVFALSRPLQVSEKTVEMHLAVAATTAIKAGQAQIQTDIGEQSIQQKLTAQLLPGETLTLEQFVVVRLVEAPVTSVAAFSHRLQQLKTLGFNKVLQHWQPAWDTFWQTSDVVIEGNTTAQQAMRYTLYQVFQHRPHTARETQVVGMQQGRFLPQVNWEMLPHTLEVFQEVLGSINAKAIMQRLFDHLPIARAHAGALGLQGAFFPTRTRVGKLVKQDTLRDEESIYVGALLVLAIKSYVDVTNDRSYLSHHGAEIAIEVARFYMQRITYLPENKRYSFLAVTAPNQFEINENHNWLTNTLAKCTFDFVLKILPHVDQALLVALQFTQDEAAQLKYIAQNMYLLSANQQQVLPQSQSYVDKIGLPVLNQLAPGAAQNADQLRRSSFVSFPEVLLGLLYFEDNYDREVKVANFNYYQPLIKSNRLVVNNLLGTLAAHLQLKSEATERTLAALDMNALFANLESSPTFEELMTNWTLLVHGLANLQHANGQLSLRPFCPRDWQRYTFHLRFQERLLQITVSSDVTEVQLLTGYPLTIQLDGHAVILE